MDIIAAIPEESKAILLPLIRAKPVRTVGGGIGLGTGIWNRSGRRHVQTSSMPSYCDDG